MDNQQPSNNSIYYQKPAAGHGFIYKYTSPSGKSYIGQTVNTLAERAKNIVSGRGYKKCDVFWKAIQKYSFCNFKVEILCEKPIHELNYWEEYYISLFNTQTPIGYNITSGGAGGKKKEVYVYSAQNGKFLEHYASLSEAARMTEVPIETISSIMSPHSTRRQAHNLIFSEQYYENFELSELSRANYHKVFVYKEDGSFLKEFSTLSGASEELRISVSTIIRHLEDGHLTCGYYFKDNKIDKIETVEKLSKKGKMVCQISPTTYETIKVYPSLAKAAREVGLSSGSSIMKAIERNGKSAGFYWRIVEGSTTKSPKNPTGLCETSHGDEDIV